MIWDEFSNTVVEILFEPIENQIISNKNLVNSKKSKWNCWPRYLLTWLLGIRMKLESPFREIAFVWVFFNDSEDLGDLRVNSHFAIWVSK